MTDGYRITIRNVDPELADLLRDLAIEAEVTLGEAFDDAVEALEEKMDAEDQRRLPTRSSIQATA